MEKNVSKKVMLKCELCNVELPNECSLIQHNSGKKHLKLFKANELERRAKQKCGIFVKGYPHDTGAGQILSYFSTFGTIVWSHFGHNYILIDFSEPVAVQQIMKLRHKLNGRFLTIKYREFKIIQPIFEKKMENTKNLLEQLKCSKSLQQQLQVLTRYLQGDQFDEYYSKINRVCLDLYQLIVNVFPQSYIQRFGSSVTGLHFLNSDIDIYISGIKREKDDDTEYLFKLKRILNNSHCFSNLLVVGQAKIPILKCVHNQTQINCDINIRNMLGVCNSNLINYYISIDRKIKDIMLIIKYWAKVHKLTGQNHLFTNYSLYLMIIFFLQGIQYQLPSVKSLQSDRNCNNFQEYWNGGFKQIQANCPNIKQSTLLDLLKNFFSYYGNFDYSTYIICPFLGKTIKKNDFRELDNLSNDFNNYKKFCEKNKNYLKIENIVCVQDPFEHSRNTTPIVSESTLNIFIKFCRLGSNLCQQGDDLFFYNLFSKTPVTVNIELLTQANFTQFGIQMGTHTKYLKDKTNTEDLKELWFESVNKFTLIVLRDFLNMTVENKMDPLKKVRKLDEQDDIHFNSGLTIASYKCCGKLNLWHSRKIALKDVDTKSLTLIEREMNITKYLVDLYKDINLSENIIEFDLVLEKRIEPPQVIFNLTKTYSYKKTFKNFGIFLSSKFASLFDMYEKDLDAALT